MRRIAVFTGSLLLTFATPAFAHRLDEYLQATTILVSRDHVQVQLRLAPGVAVLPIVLGSMDADGDGTISEAEERAYAERVLGDLSLSVDGRRLPLRVVSSTFATVDDLRRGLGESTLELEAKLPAGSGSRRLVFENSHQRRIAAYLVNALAPGDPSIRITSQNRDYRQSSFTLDFVQAKPGWRFVSFDVVLKVCLFLSGAIVLLAQLLVRRRPRRTGGSLDSGVAMS
jgi:hypothetical protein